MYQELCPDDCAHLSATPGRCPHCDRFCEKHKLMLYQVYDGSNALGAWYRDTSCVKENSYVAKPVITHTIGISSGKLSFPLKMIKLLWDTVSRKKTKE